MQLFTTTRNLQPVSKIAAGSSHAGASAVKTFLLFISSTRPQCGMRWMSGEGWRRACTMLAIVITSLIFLPRHLHSQASTNLPLVLASGEQHAPALVSDGQDGAFVIWHDERDNRTAIYAQRLNALSQPLWKPDGILIATSPKDQLALTAIADGKNGVLIFWQDWRNDAGDIYGQRVETSGNLLWGATGVEVNRAAGKQAEPQAVSDGEGGAFVVWRDFKLSHEDITVQRIDGTGKILFEPAGRIVAQGLNNQMLGEVTATNDGGFIAVWTDNSLLLGAPRVAAQRFDAKANPLWKDNVFVTTTRSTQNSPVAHFAATNNGAAGSTFVIWSDDRNRNDELFAQKIDATGAIQWGAAGVTVCKASNDQANPQIIGDGSDGILVAWEDQRSGKTDIYAQAVNAAGQTRWPSDGVIIVATSQEQTQPQIIPDGDGGMICVWSDERNSGTNIAAQRLDKNGKALWEANGIFITPEGGTKQHPAILALSGNFAGSNGSLVAWEDTRRGNEDIFAQALKSDGTLANVPPIITSSPVTEAPAGSLYNYQIKALDYDSSDPLRLELVAPAGKWLQVDPNKLQLFGTPGVSDAGEIAVTIAVKDKPGAQVTQSFSLKVIVTNRPPQIISKPDTIATEDQLYSYQIVASDPDPGDALTYSLQTDASWLKLTTGNKITGTPANDHVGNYAVTLQVTDKLGFAATQKFSLHVKNVNDPPAFTSKPDTVATEDQLYSYKFAAVDPDRGDALTYSLQTNATWLHLTSDNKLTGTPANANVGSHAVTLRATDRQGVSAAQTFSVRVKNVNNPPVFTSQPDTVATEDQLYSYKFAAGDPDPGDALTYALQTDAAWLKLANDNKLTGTPTNENVGSYTVTLRATDKQNVSTSQRFSLRVKNVNDPPVFTSKPDTVAMEDQLYVYKIAVFDPDRDETLTYSLQSEANWLRLTTDNQLTGAPTNEHVGNFSVTLGVIDRQGASASQRFSLRVRNVNNPPEFTSQPDTVATEDQLYSYKFTAADPDLGEVLSFSLQSNATWLKLTNDNKLTGTPANDHVGSYTVTLRATDRQNISASQNFSLRVKNVNDPPVFTSQPDTIATVDSLYIYRPTVADVDRGDAVQIIKRTAPEWLSWNPNTRTLQGKPNSQQAGTVHLVSLQARDAAGVAVEQNFRIRVVSLSPPDVTAPAAAQAVQIEPAQWSANKKFTLRWQNPFDPSRVTGAYYKIGAPPAHNQDGVFVASPDGVTIDQLELLATREGKTPIYLWLVDGRGNVDFRTAVAINYRYDATPPTAPQNLAPHRQWNRGDSLLLKWTPSTDATSGIRRYHFFLDEKFFGFVNGDAGSFALILQLSEGEHGWTFMPEDSAGNLGQWVGASFKVDRTPPTLQHNAIDSALAATDLVLSTQTNDALAGIREVRLYYRAAGESTYRNKILQNAGAASFTVRLEAAEIPAKGLQYFFETADSAGNRARWPPGAPENFQSLVVNSASVDAPAPFVANRYQLFSVPYLLLNESPAQWLEDDLGSYDQTVWRLFRYQQDEGNVELGKPNFGNFAPGRAYWLITTTPQNFDAGPVRSLRTNAPFALKLQPGWNLIATPFDFPTAWPATQKPESVENNLWAFDGTKYLDQQNTLLPWQGYFLRNLDSQPQIISIAPVAGNGVNKSAEPAPEINWQVQLRVSDGDFSDEANYLGVASRAVENWDPLDLSEPPTIGEHVSLYFDHHDWPRFGGKFTRDFRPAGDAAQQWPFVVVASRPGLPVELRWNLSGDFPADWIFLLQDVDGHIRREIQPQEFHHEENYTFRATAQPRHFIWWAGKKEQLDEAGALRDLVPAAFELAPSYPNPLRLADLPQIGVIRFGLPNANSVRLTIFDMAGRTVRTLVHGENLNAGYHEVRWNGRDNLGRAVTAGIYIYRLEAANFSASHKLILLR